jgi:tRNA (guanine-N7-)-methyltransferase
VIQNDNKIIIKSDKTTRPASVHILHKALNEFVKVANLEVLYSNVPQDKSNPHLTKITALKDIDYFANNFPTDKEVRIEIGFGSGRHLLYQAKKHKDILFIGIEIHRPSIEQVLKQININSLDNVLLLDYDARLFLEQVQSNIVGKIYIHFPVPWDKKPHRRVISENFVQEAKRVLKVGGKLELRTDSENYYRYSFETFMSFDKVDLNIKKNQDIEISSKYEDRWKRMEKNIYDLYLTNDIYSEALEIKGNFDFKDIKPDIETIKGLHAKKIVDEGYFVNFERVYKIDDKFYMLKVSFGSFDRPEHSYIAVKKDDIKYFIKTPLKSKANLKAHQKILEVLNG